MTAAYLIAGVILVITALVVRDQTQFKLIRLRSELLALRTEEQRLSEERVDLERMIAQIGDALMRADNRKQAAERAHDEVVQLLEGLGIEVDSGQAPENAGTTQAEA